MIELLTSLFREAGYDYQVIGERPVLKHCQYGDYWMIAESGCLEKQEEIYAGFTQARAEAPDFAKNFSVLFLNRLDGDSPLTKETCIRAENDEFYFKKYVLSFNNADLDGLFKIIEKYQGQSLASILMRPEVFEQLKAENGSGPVTTAYCIALKLPFLMMTTEATEYNPAAFLEGISSESKDMLSRGDGMKEDGDRLALIEELIKPQEDEV